MPEEHKDAIEKMQIAYDDFINQLEELKSKGAKVIKGQISEDDHDKLKEIQEKIKNINA